MQDTIYLTMSQSGIKKMSKRSPRIEADEIAIEVVIAVPDEVFEEYIPSATLTVPPNAVMGNRCTIKVEDFSTEDLLKAEQQIVVALASRPDCPAHLTTEEVPSD